jgi:CheY-like chemotaxis protein
MCTGYSSMISKEKAKEIGIERFVMKPVSRENLAIIVREVLDKKKS